MDSKIDRLDKLLSSSNSAWDDGVEAQDLVNALNAGEWEFLYDTWHIRSPQWLDYFSGILESSIPAQLKMMELMLETGFYGDGPRLLLEEMALNKDYIPPERLMPSLRELLIAYQGQSDVEYIEALIKRFEERK